MTINRDHHMIIARELLGGRTRAHAKHGDNSIEAIDPADPRWLATLVEEVGEAAHELTYDSDGDLRAELVDVATVAIAWIAAIDRATGEAPQQPAMTPRAVPYPA